MKSTNILILYTILVSLVFSFNPEKHGIKLIMEKYMNESPKEIFKIWHLLHQKTYDLSGDEGLERYKNFKKNLERVKKHNSNPNRSYSLALNHFADHTKNEFKDRYLTNPQKMFSGVKDDTFSKIHPIGDSPDSQYKFNSILDYSSHKNYNKVYDQENCGSCWAYAVVQTVEWEYLIKKNKEINLSVQQLVDCDEGSSGCQGGLFHTSLKYIKQNGLQLAKDYKYVSKTEKCRYDQTKEKVGINGLRVCMNEKECVNDVSLHETLKKGPVAVVLDASEEFMLYSEGVYDNECKDANHAVLLLGYKEDTNEDGYWIIKNSWGSLWGDSGYIKIKRSKNYNSCLINTYYGRPTIKSETNSFLN